MSDTLNDLERKAYLDLNFPAFDENGNEIFYKYPSTEFIGYSVSRSGKLNGKNGDRMSDDTYANGYIINRIRYSPVICLLTGKKSRLIMRSHIVCGTFFHNPDPEIYREVDHINGDILNNSASNVRWATRIINMNNTHNPGIRVAVIETTNDGKEKFGIVLLK